ncbi:hypothetical protein [Nonomuraea sp. NPDC048826]|uniref:hypothetical protein n=1 Tax=Nonomuraea sp. NPDC048826 TaxID=3364347 RepID=UPI0037140DF8
MVGAVFGMVFVAVNAGAPLPPAAGTALRVLAGLALAGVIALWFLTGRRTRGGATEAGGTEGGTEGGTGGGTGGGMFNRRYVVIVALEAVALFGGVRLLSALGWPEQAGVAWVALVVGVHFVALWPVWREVSILIPGAGLTVLGLVGLALVWTQAVAWVPIVSGVLSGLLLLGGSVFYAQRTFRALPRG